MAMYGPYTKAAKKRRNSMFRIPVEVLEGRASAFAKHKTVCRIGRESIYNR